MEIKYFGYNCFRIRSKQGTVITDPFLEAGGKKAVKAVADVVLLTRGQKSEELGHISAAAGRTEPYLIREAGEYEVSGMFIEGVVNGKVKCFAVETEGLHLVYMPEWRVQLGSETAEVLTEVDVLMLSLDSACGTVSEAVHLVNQIEPRVVVPMSYWNESGLEEKKLADFFKEMGQPLVETTDKLVLTSGQLPQERQAVVLSAKGE